MHASTFHWRLVVAAVVSFGLATVALGQQVVAQPIAVEQPWIRATPGGAKVAGGFMTITNTGTEADRLIGGTLPQAGRFEVHEMKMEGGVARMRPVTGGLEIKPGQKVELKPGGLHVMFTDLRQPLKQGEKIKGQLRFEKAGSIDIEYTVEGIGARAAPKHSH